MRDGSPKALSPVPGSARVAGVDVLAPWDPPPSTPAQGSQPTGLVGTRAAAPKPHLAAWRAGLVAVLAVLSMAVWPTASSAAVHTVTSTLDTFSDNEVPPPGSLRQIIENVAGPGDTIRFDTSGPVELRHALTIPPELAGLTLQGPGRIVGNAPPGIVIRIAANNVGLLDFEQLTGIKVSVGLLGASVANARIANNRFFGLSRNLPR